MNDHLWMTEKRTQALFNLIQNLRWDDQAARDIHLRYLRPLETDSKAMLTAYKDQDTSLEVVSVRIMVARKWMRDAYQAGQDVAREHRYFQEEIRRAEYEYERGITYESLARYQLPNIQSLIDNAYRAGA